MYEIIDIQTKRRVGTTYESRQRAQRRADRLDMEYGAVRYVVYNVEARAAAKREASDLARYEWEKNGGL